MICHENLSPENLSVLPCAHKFHSQVNLSFKYFTINQLSKIHAALLEIICMFHYPVFCMSFTGSNAKLWATMQKYLYCFPTPRHGFHYAFSDLCTPYRKGTTLVFKW